MRMQYEKGEFILVPNKHALLGVKGATQSVYLWICAHADDNGICWPSVATIAKKAGVSTRSVFNCIKQLEQKGILKKTTRKSRDGSKRKDTNLYQLIIVKASSQHAVRAHAYAAGAEPLVQELHDPHAPVAEKLKPMNVNPIEQNNTDLKNPGTPSEPPSSMVEEEKTSAEISAQAGDPINAVIAQFKMVNEAYAKFYARPVERKAAEALLQLHTMGEIVSVLEYVRDHMGEPYAIAVNRPVQLEEKWTQLAAKMKKSAGDNMFKKTQEELKNPKFGKVLKV